MAPMLRLYNTLTREKAAFAPIDPTHVRMYACGPTVYDAAHIGNARPIIVFDLLFRLLRYLYGEAHVTYARNVTDVDDKINARALDRGISIRELTDGTLADFHADIRELGVLMPDAVNVAGERPRFVEPRATDHILEMVHLIEGLVAAGHAYVAADHVLFDVPSMPDYGALSKRPLDEMEAGARVEVAPYKRSPLDFVLWKPSKPGEPSWPSPSGIAAPGRPGWHIECSAMSWKHLGKTFDIHAGGIDLIFPHHENEVAQSRCCFGTDVMANVWLHNGFLQVEGQKMSKSLGNFVTIRDVLKDWPGEVVRLAMLKTHYRQPIDWTLRGLAESQKTLEKWWRACGNSEPAEEPDPAFIAALCDDLNTPQAIAELHHLRSRDDHAALARCLIELGFPIERYHSSHVDIGQDLPAPFASGSHKTIRVDQSDIDRLTEERRLARIAKDWAESDRIRTELAGMGIALKDGKDGTIYDDGTTTWTVAPMIAPSDRQPIIVADTGPLIRLAAAGILDTLRGLNRRIVLVDRVEDEVVGDLTKPFAPEIAAWIGGLGEAALRVETVVGIGVAALRARTRTQADDALLKSALRDSSEQALREFVAHWHPAEAASAVVLYEDRKVATLFLDVNFPVTLMTTRAFVATVTRWGINQDAMAALEVIATRYDLKPALVAEIDPDQPRDLRMLPQPLLAADEG